MNETPRSSRANNDLQSHAVASLRSDAPAPVSPASEPDALALAHELQVHQIELEMQNEELQRAQRELEALAARYRDLYEFAPIGYLTLDAAGRVLEANLAGAELLGMGRRDLIHQPFASFLVPDSQIAFRSLNSLLQETEVKQSCELCLSRHDSTTLYVQAEVAASGSGEETDRQLRVAMMDITSRKQAIAYILATGIERRQAEHTALEHIKLLTGTLDALTDDLELERFLERILMALAEQLAAEYVALWFADKTQETLSLHALCRGGKVLPGAQSGHPGAPTPLDASALPFWSEVCGTRQPVVLQDFAASSPVSMLAEVDASQGVPTLLLAPLLLGPNALGLICLQSAGRRQHPPWELEFTQAMAQQAALAVQMARLAEQGRRAAVLQERNRMAQEIHDTLAQGFTGILMQLAVVEETLTDAPQEARRHLQQARDLARASLAEVRRSVRALRPQALEQQNLPSALANLLARMTADSGVEVRLNLQGTVRALPEEIENNLLRIGQEALSNALKHAHAKTIHLELTFEPSLIRLSVRDDGRGFDSTSMDDQNHFGLKMMRERTERLEGQFQLSSRPGQGAEVTVTVPTLTLNAREK